MIRKLYPCADCGEPQATEPDGLCQPCHEAEQIAQAEEAGYGLDPDESPVWDEWTAETRGISENYYISFTHPIEGG